MHLGRSADLYKTAQNSLPGGVNSPARAWTAVGGNPVFIAKGKGSKIWDVDGNQYIDYLSSWGPMILGHAHPEIINAIKAVVEMGTSFGSPTEGETKLAEMIITALPSIDMVRLVNSGTEAGMSALRLARAYTNRDKIVKFEGGYHGHTDALLVSAGSGAATHGIPTSAGVTKSTLQDTLVAKYNDISSVRTIFDSYPKQIACVIIEAVAANMGVIAPKPGFLKELREITRNNGALLIFDEVVSGFRVSYGGAQQLYSVTPDITCLGKIIGGGLPIGAYGGQRKIMETVSPTGPMYQAGTLSGNPIAIAAGLKTLELLKTPGIYNNLETKSEKLSTGVKEVFSHAKIPLEINRVGSMMTLFFSDTKVTEWESVARSDKKGFANFFQKMLQEGIYLPPSPFEAMFVSNTHRDSDIQKTVDAVERALS